MQRATLALINYFLYVLETKVVSAGFSSTKFMVSPMLMPAVNYWSLTVISFSMSTAPSTPPLLSLLFLSPSPHLLSHFPHIRQLYINCLFLL